MKSSCQAPKCDTPADGALCPQHTRTLERHLAELPSMLGQLQITIARLDRLNGNGRGRYVTRRVWSENDDPEYTADTTLVAHPLPFSWDAALVMEAASGTLLSWARHLSELRGLDLAPRLNGYQNLYGPACIDCDHKTCRVIRNPSVPSTETIRTRLAVWLTANVAAIAVDVAGGQAYDELVSLSIAVREAVDARPLEVFVGHCDKETVRFTLRGDTLFAEDVRCTADLYAKEGKTAIKCGKCGTEYDVTERRKLMLDALDDQRMIAERLARALTTYDLPITSHMIRDWAYRSRERRAAGKMPGPHEIYPVGMDEEGHPLYRVGDVRVRVEAAREVEKTRQAERAHNRKTRAA